MPHAVGASAGGLLECKQRELAGAIEVAFAVLVMNRQCLGRELTQVAETRQAADAPGLGQLDDRTPRCCGFSEAAVPPEPQRATVERLTFHFRLR